MAAVLVFAGKPVATAAISFLVTKALGYLDKYRKSEGMEEVQSRLRQAMPQIQSVFDVVRPQRFREQQSSALDEWLWQLRDAVEEAEDSIDELEYHELEAKAKDRKVSDQGSYFSKMKHRFVRSVKHASPSNKTLKRLVKAVDGLDRAAAGVANFLVLTEHLRGTAYSSQQQAQLVDYDLETGSTLCATIFVGREKEKEQIIQWLTNTSAESAQAMASTSCVPIVSVVGHGGMGKTTLAQSVCETSEVRERFEVIWVSVSTAFHATSVTSKILECVTGKKPSANHLAPLQKSLLRIMKSNTFLLVLDDVWEDNKRGEWEKLFAPLRKLNTGSKILLTTRMQSVADMAASVMGVKRDQCLTLQGLEEDKNLELFNHHVFSGLNSEDYLHLKVIGEQIARKLGGCPLVTKVTSGHLQGNMTTEYWTCFLDEGFKSFMSAESDIISVLRLSYYHLPTELQVCFRYCSLFPVDHVFCKEDLVQMWIGSGLISQATSHSKSLKDTAEQFLAQLTRKSFFDLKSRAWKGRVITQFYLMSGIMHDLARTMSSGECARITDPARFGDEKETVRHLCVSELHIFSVEQINKISCFKSLRTIIIDSNCEVAEEIVCALEKIIESSKSLRLIHSGLRNTFHFPDKFVNLKHLRYMSLDRISTEGMYESAKLYHLTLLHLQSGIICRE